MNRMMTLVAFLQAHPSINAVLKAIAKRKDPKPPKSSTRFNRWLKKMDAVVGDGLAMSDNLGHLTATESGKVAAQMEGWIEMLKDAQSLVCGIAKERS